MDTYERSEPQGGSGMSVPEPSFPADFLPDETDFAEDLRSLFPIECEELPPLYTQTLLGDATHTPLDKHFERKLTYRVFRQLGLARPLPQPRRLAGMWRPPVLTTLRRLGPVSAALVACALLFMVVSIIAASPSFADGMRLLLGHSGVDQVPSYPTNTRPSASMAGSAGQSGMANHPLNWVEWLGSSVQGYSFEATYIAPAQEWTDGPVVELRYIRQDALASPGSGVLEVREFRPSPSLAGVLQMVADGSATAVSVNGQAGVYVDGQWVPTVGRPVWQSGIRGELIFERDGLVFWIVADQRDGVGSDQLVAAATHLVPVSLHTIMPDRSALRLVSIDLQGSLQSPVEGELLELIPAGSSLDSGTGAFVSYRPGMPLAR